MATAAEKKAATTARLKELAARVSGREIAERAKEVTVQTPFIKILSDADGPEFDKTKPEFIKGAKHKDFVILPNKIVLGASFDAIPLAGFAIYEDVEDLPETEKRTPKVRGYWMPEDAANIPVVGYFDRPYLARIADDKAEARVLKPGHWLFVQLDEHKELGPVKLRFRSTANGYYKDLQKALGAQTKVSSEVVITVTVDPVRNDGYKKTFLYPKLEITGRNFSLDDDFDIKIEKGSAFTVDDALAIMEKADALTEEYEQNKLIAAKKDIAKLIAPAGGEKPKAALGAGSKSRAAQHVEDDDPAF